MQQKLRSNNHGGCVCNPLTNSDEMSDNKIKAQFQFWYSQGRGYSVGRTKEFNDLYHYDNYINWMERKGYTLDEVWTEDERLIKHLQG